METTNWDFLNEKLGEILAKINALPTSFPERESDEYDAGFQEALREFQKIVENYLKRK